MNVRLCISKHKALVAAVGVYIIANALDFISTGLVGAFVQGASEGNLLARDVHGHALMIPLLGLKMMFTVLIPGLYASAIYIGTENETFASIPVYYFSLGILAASFNNFALLYRG